MTLYPQRVAENVLPLSISGELSEALKEWYFTERTEDHEVATESCELCDQEQLRYHFEIENKSTRKRLWVGSSCILRFNVAVFENGQVLDKKSAEKKLNQHIAQMRLDACIASLKALAEKEHNTILDNALNYYQKNKCLTPKFAFVVFWRLDTQKIDFHPSFFKISLKRDSHKKDLANMHIDRVHLIWKALSSSQRKMAIKFGHTEPST
ncbi:hypothetical protein [Vibrio anguillarum]|uniref:Uncharacterized protein n=3 Tax=Vibrio anguillarum TaxID=55601 RepID=A0ABD4QZF1_VIBAN|nr:hypothetical protein [Vibrio anguillarum]ASG01802.1 hypothetical protein CEG15_16960 [Vibrio anguillarum]ASG05477.1 hypothetical protein CEJ46_16895 [Vibrio anguillarum]MBT2920568.1 hypothetical protein [Vibrio anguillarum]